MKGVELAKAEICRQWESIDDEVKEHFNVNALVLDMIYCLHRFGTSFEEYFVFKYYERNTLEEVVSTISNDSMDSVN